MSYTPHTTCRVCTDFTGEKPLTTILDLGETPLADKFPASPTEDETYYPLTMAVCGVCKAVQLGQVVDDKELFGDDYAFFTGASPSSVRYFANYAQDTMDRYPEQSKGLVVEIASNDGTLLKHFQDIGATVLGIDPAVPPAEKAIEDGVPTYVEPFDLQSSRYIEKAHGKASLILANNVVAHVDRLSGFLSGIYNLLSDDGIALIEFQYLPHLLKNNAFDHVYHEHRSFFALAPFKEACRRHYLNVVDAIEADTQGGSLRVTLKKDPYLKIKPSQKVLELLEAEKAAGLTGVNGIDAYKALRATVQDIRADLRLMLWDLKKQGKTIYGFGASAKGNTLLNYCGIGPDLLDFVVDTTPYKIGKYTPGTHIEVISPDMVKEQPDYYLVLVWNYLPGILEREKGYLDRGGHFIVPIPSPVII